MRLIRTFKQQVRNTSWLYEPIRQRKALQQEKEYLQLREQYYHRLPHGLASPGYLVYSQKLLDERWLGPRTVHASPKDVRILAIASNDWEHRSLLPNLADNFDTVVLDFGTAGYLPRLKGRDVLQDAIITTAREAHEQKPLDLIFTYGHYGHFKPETFRQLHNELGVPTVDLCLDDKHSFLQNPNSVPSGQLPLIGAFDVHLTNSLECVRWYLAEGVLAFYFPEGCNPAFHRPMDIEQDIDVSFVGKRYGFRTTFIDALAKHGIKIECFGPGWPNGPATQEQMIEIFNRSRINLGIGGVALSNRITCLKTRDFAVPPTGQLYLTTYDAELARMYHLGREILCYFNEIDCVELIRYYLANPAERRAIAEVGRERCIREHTWAHRMISLLRWMGILAGDEDFAAG